MGKPTMNQDVSLAKVGGGFEYFFYFHPEPWGNDPISTNIFQMDWFNHQPAKYFDENHGKICGGLSGHHWMR